jgi:hypothetical protein
MLNVSFLSSAIAAVFANESTAICILTIYNTILKNNILQAALTLQPKCKANVFNFVEIGGFKFYGKLGHYVIVYFRKKAGFSRSGAITMTFFLFNIVSLRGELGRALICP